MKQDRRILGFLFIIGIAVSLFTAGAKAQRRERLVEAWQPEHFDVNLALASDLSKIDSATTTISVIVRGTAVTTIDLDFGKLPVSEVKVNGKVAQFRQHDTKLDVSLAAPAAKDQRIKISVTYAGIPEDGLILTKDNDGNPSAIGDNWADRVHNWIPCLDHPSAKASVRFAVTVANEYVVVANGFPVSAETNMNGTKTWVFDEIKPVSPYNMVVAVGKFATAQVAGATPIPIAYYVVPSKQGFAAQGFSPAPPSIVTFSNLIAPYPYKKLALIVGATRFGGMENANTIVFAADFFANFLTAKRKSPRFNMPAGREETIAHEIAHQWFGDSVTESTWADLWLSEGFATYFAGVFLEKNEGREAFLTYMREKATNYFAYEKQRSAPIHDVTTENLFDLLNPNNYEKGGWVLHMLRGRLGDKVFFAGLRTYYREHKESTATTEDLRSALERASGRNLKAFFDRWVYKAGHPVYKITWEPAGRGRTRLTLSQEQPSEAFTDPVTVELKGATTRRFVIRPAGKVAVIVVRRGRLKGVVVDPNEVILKEVVN